MAWRNAIKLSKNGHPQSLTNIKQNLAINAIQKKEKDSEKVSDVIIKIDTQIKLRQKYMKYILNEIDRIKRAYIIDDLHRQIKKDKKNE